MANKKQENKKVEKKNNKKLYLFLSIVIILLLIFLFIEGLSNYENLDNGIVNTIMERIKKNGVRLVPSGKKEYNGASEVSSPKVKGDKISFSFMLPNADSIIEYKIRVKNNSDVKKIIKEIKSNNPNVSVKLKNANDSIINANSEKEITLVFSSKIGGSTDPFNVDISIKLEDKKKQSTSNKKYKSGTSNKNNKKNTNANTTTQDNTNSNNNSSNVRGTSSYGRRSNRSIYTVELIDDGNVISSKQYYEGDSIDVRTVSKKGYTFLYWSDSENGSQYDLSRTVTGNLKLYSVYRINTYKITIIGPNGEKIVIEKAYGQAIGSAELPTAEPREGYTPVWYIKGTNTPYDLTKGIDGDIELELRYEIIKNEVVFNDENRITSVKVDYNNTVYPISSKGKEGYAFEHWSLNLNGTPYDFETKIKEAFTLYAIYRPKKYTITIIDANGNEVTKEVEFDSTYGELPTPEEREGYDFVGWFNEDGDLITSDTKVDVSKNQTLTPRYVKKKYTVTYNYEENGGSTVSSQTKETEYEANIDLSVSSTKTGYTFLGWNTDKDATTVLNSLTIGSSNVTLYAIYKRENSVTFKANGNILYSESSIIPGSSEKKLTCTVYNNDRICEIVAPTIESENTPTVIGFSDASNKHESSINSGESIIIDENGFNNKSTYYAQTTKERVDFNVTYTKDDTVSEIGKSSEICSIPATYNGTVQATTCKITFPSITLKGGYNSPKWYENQTIYNIGDDLNISESKEFIAKGIPGVYLMTIKDANGNIIGTKEVTKDSVYGELPEAEEREGYTFIGYFDKDDNEITADTKVDVTGDLEIIPKYSKNSYKVTYNYSLNGGTSATSSEKYVEFEDNVDLTVTATKSGYTFLGWSLENDNTSVLEELTMGSSNITLYAIYKRENSVVFNANNNVLTLDNRTVTGTNSIETSCYAYNNETNCDVTAPSISNDVTTLVIGYSDVSTKYEKQIESNQTISIDGNGYNNRAVYYAQTYNDEISYSVTYEKEESIKTIEKENDSCKINKVYNGVEQPTYCEVTLPQIEEKVGYENGKWYEDDHNYNPNSTLRISSNRTFTASATIKQYTVTFRNYNEDEISSTTVNHGDVVAREEDQVRTYYDFKWWSTSKNGSAYDFATPVTGNLTLYAVYSIKHYVITINDDGAETTQTVEAGSLLSNALPEANKTGYDFSHWAYSNDVEVDETEIVDRDISVHSVYTIHTYTIKFFEEETKLKEIGKDYNTQITLEDLPDVEREGFNHNWYLLNSSEPYDLNSNVESDLSLYVRYKKIVNGVTFVIGANETVVGVEYGDKIDQTKIPDPTKVGYTFNHWSEEQNGNTPYDLNSTIIAPVKVYAVYTPITSTITFKDENDIVIGTKDVTYDTTYGELPEIPAKEGYTAIGWYIGNTKIESDTIVNVATATDIKPKYEINKYKVTYNYAENGGVSSTKQEEMVNYNAPIDLEVAATKNNYIFVGWNTDKNATTRLETLTMGTEPVTLYAIYKVVNEVSFNANNNKLMLGTGEVTGENNYDVSCEAFNKESSCEITVPTISNNVTPTVIGYSTGKNIHENQLSSGSTITINGNGYNNITKYYAQTSKASITYTTTYTKEDSVSEISKASDSCTIDAVYNGAAQATTCPITLPNITEENGYENGKWHTTGTSYNENTVVNISENSSYVARATIKEYTVTFKDYNDTVLSTETVNHGSAVAQPNNPTRTYYNFKYWSTSKTGSAYNFSTPVTNNTTLYAVYEIQKYTVTFISDGTTLSSEIIEAGTVINFEDATKTGYDFKHWSETENGSATTKTVVESNLTFYAVFEKHKYTITFKDENNTKIKDIKVKYQETIPSGDVPSTEKEGYSFDGWFESGSSIAFNLTTAITRDITISKKYTRIKKGVTFDDEGRTTLVDVNYGDTVSPIDSQGKTGYTFSCWSETKNCTNVFDFTTQIKEVKTIYAVYTANTYTVTFKNESGGTVSSKEVTYDSTYGTLPTVPEKTGYTSTGWYIGNNKIETTTKVTILQNTDITPKYSINSYTLTINKNNGTSNVQETVQYNATYTLTPPTKTGYTFSNWSVSGTGSSVSDNTFTMGSANATVTANYTPNKYKITLNNNGATSAGTAELYESYNTGFYLESTLTTKVTKITKPEKTGYTFNGYYDGTTKVIDESGNILMSETKYTDAKTITASWTINSYTLTINKNNGTANDAVTLTYGATKTVSNPTKTGYTFNNWTVSGTGSSITNGTFTMGSANATLTANYTKNSYQVKYDGNSATSGSMSNSTHTYDEAKNLTKNAYSRNGYTFVGWNTNKNATTALYTDEKSVTNLSSVHNDVVTLYAIWSINSYSLTVNPNGGSYDGKTTNTVYSNVQYSSTKTIANASKTGYDFSNWTVSGTGSSMSGTTFTMGYANATLTANFTPHIYTINLDQTGTTTNGTTKIYLKYNTGYYKDSSASQKMSTTANDIVVPEKLGYVFNGYFTGQNGTGTKVIDNRGYFTGNVTNTQFTSNQTLYASYTQITASMLQYTDTYSMGCTDAGCALDKLFQLLN